MTTLFVRHQVADYAQWRQVYDRFATTQKALGVQDQAVYQAIDNPNDVTVRHEFATLEAAQAFGSSAELSSAMHDAGVNGAPTVWFTTRS
ncbi:MAG: cyclase [Candidatus Limnocylindrales bacterium]